MKVLYLTKYTRMAGSSRMRSFQYFPYLEKAGIQPVAKPFFDDAYLRDLYAGKKNIFSVLKSYIRRFFVLFTVFRYDIVVIEKEIFPYLPAFAEKILQILCVKYIADYDDAIFHNYDQSRNPLIRKFLGNKIGKVMKYSRVTVAGNQYLADYAVKSGAGKVEIIPTVIDLDRYTVKRDSISENENFVVGWIGTKTTFEKHLLPCKKWIKEIQEKDPDIEFHIIGITEDMDLGNHIRYIPWTEKTEVEGILKMDIGIMPLEDSLWERGKCAYKLIQYAACGIPGIASDVGMNREVTIQNETGFLVSSDEEWINRIFELKNNREERKLLGMNARKLVEEKYCIQVTAERWCNLLGMKRTL
ncbi:glycosyltransferase family 4 protein [Moheibacter stercoris]|uniref:Glycosyltransferase involved in cell wall biosynthesis n=1 Tax=Moheibacter stercoris TaxID=1628251 RepID=A0ABV2LPM4_9FLAO